MYAYEKPKALKDKRRESITAEEKNASASAFGQQPQSAAQLKSGGKDMEVLHNKLIQRIESQRNNTGLPDDLKNGIENLSGFSMGDVRVHYNSSKPAQLNAHAYTQGTEIHVAPGQEKHLPHEAWHVVQQMQGRVKPTLRMNGTNVNDDPSLEREATAIGAKANSFSGTAQLSAKKHISQPCVQCELVNWEISQLMNTDLVKRIKILRNQGKDIDKEFSDPVANFNSIRDLIIDIRKKRSNGNKKIDCTPEEVKQIALKIGLKVEEKDLPKEAPPKEDSEKEATCEKDSKVYKIKFDQESITSFKPEVINKIKNDPIAVREKGVEGRAKNGQVRLYHHVGGKTTIKPFWFAKIDEKNRVIYIKVVGVYMHVGNNSYRQTEGIRSAPEFITLTKSDVTDDPFGEFTPESFENPPPKHPQAPPPKYTPPPPPKYTPTPSGLFDESPTDPFDEFTLESFENPPPKHPQAPPPKYTPPPPPKYTSPPPPPPEVWDDLPPELLEEFTFEPFEESPPEFFEDSPPVPRRESPPIPRESPPKRKK